MTLSVAPSSSSLLPSLHSHTHKHAFFIHTLLSVHILWNFIWENLLRLGLKKKTGFALMGMWLPEWMPTQDWPRTHGLRLSEHSCGLSIRLNGIYHSSLLPQVIGTHSPVRGLGCSLEALWLKKGLPATHEVATQTHTWSSCCSFACGHFCAYQFEPKRECPCLS